MKFEWNEVHENCFQNIKNQWKKELELLIPDADGKFEVETDASEKGLGAVLRQDGKPIAYISKNLSKEERNYGITEKEFLACIWAMEAFQYYLVGKSFKLITDHKAIESVNKKAEFGNSRIQRWIERLNRFDFVVEYRPGCEIVQADALSRSTQLSFNKGDGKISENEEKIIKLHIELNHRKTIKEILKIAGIEIRTNKLKEILEKCETCKRKDIKIRGKSGKFIETYYPGEIIGVDILQISNKEKVILGIDYFSRKIYGAVINTKEKEKVINFLKNVQSKQKINKLVTDSGLEFNNQYVKDWAKENEVEHELVTPYYHEGNGRIERANRTIRNAIRKSKGALKLNLNRIIENYNNIVHRGIGMSPNEATREENFKKVLENQEKYKKEFKPKRFKVFNIGDSVLIKNECKGDKMQDEFKEKGKIKTRLKHNAYEILLEDGSMLRRHSSQLRNL